VEYASSLNVPPDKGTCVLVDAEPDPTYSDSVVMADRTVGYPLLPAQKYYLRWTSRRPGLEWSLFRQYRIDGELDVDAFVAALEGCVRKHDALRIGISTDHGQAEVRQWLRPTPSRAELLRCRRVAAASEEQFSRYARNVLISDVRKPWDLQNQYPFRFTLLQYSPVLHEFLAAFSHLAIDARSRGIFMRDLWRYYQNTMQGESPSRTALGERFMAAARRSAGGLARADADSGYWHAKLASAPPACQLVRTLDGESWKMEASSKAFRWSGASLERIREMARLARCSEFQWALAAFARAVFEVTKQDYIRIGIPADGRLPAERDVVGMFAIPLSICIERPANPSDLTAQIKREVLSALSHRNVPLDDLDDIEQAVARRWGSPWVHNIRANHLDLDRSDGQTRIGSLVVRPGAYRPALSRITNDLDIVVFASDDDRLDIRLVYSPSISPEMVSTLVEAFGMYIESSADADFDSARRPAHGDADLTALRDKAGRAVMWVDLRATENLLTTHPDVVSAKADVEVDEGEGSSLTAVVTAATALGAEELAEYCARQRTTDFALIPRRISIVRVGWVSARR
jgi:Condensation domain